MSLKHGLLGLLRYTPMTGYELAQLFDGSLRYFWSAQRSQIYRELNAMEKEGWVVSQIMPQTSKPNKRIYAPTPEGEKELHRWMTKDFPTQEQKARIPLLLHLFFAGSEEVSTTLDSLHAYQKEQEKQLKELESVPSQTIEKYAPFAKSDDEPVFWNMTLVYGKMQYQAQIQWAQWAIDQLEKMEKEKEKQQ